jgi:hypothetical protein
VSTIEIEYDGEPPPPPEPCPEECADWGEICAGLPMDLQARILEVFRPQDAAELGLPGTVLPAEYGNASVASFVKQHIEILRPSDEAQKVNVVSPCDDRVVLATLAITEGQWKEVKRALSTTEDDG